MVVHFFSKGQSLGLTMLQIIYDLSCLSNIGKKEANLPSGLGYPPREK